MNPYCVQLPHSHLNIAMPMSDKKKAEMAAKRAQAQAAKTYKARYNIGGSGKYFDNDKGSFSEAHVDAYDNELIKRLITETNKILQL